jgi:hypothetical protein
MKCTSFRSLFFILFLNINIICFSQQVFIAAKDNHIAYEGRIPFQQDAAILTWPGTSVYIHFKGKEISGIFKEADTSNYYNVIIDHTTIYKFHFDTIKQAYILAAGLPDTDHTLQIFKRTEWDKGRTWFYGFLMDAGVRLLDAPVLPGRKIEFLGNSITCGYGIEDYSGDSPVGYYENNYDSYAAITARHFNAQYYCTSKSGIGIMLSWFPLIMPEMYDRLDPEDSTSKWSFSKYTPDVVVINLFQNDSWLINQPEHAEFKHRFGTKKPDENFIIQSYKNFVKLVRNTYPNAQIICMLGNMDITKKGSPWPAYVKKAVALTNDPKIFTFFAPYKNTPGHPKTSEQQLLADALIGFIEQNIKW